MRKIFSLLTAYFLLIPQAFATTLVPDSRDWQYAGFGGAGTYSMIVPDHFTANKVYAIPDVNSPYVSTNKGELWSFLSYNPGAVSNFGISQTAAFVQSKTTASLMYAIDSSSGGLYKTTDTGRTWTKVATYKGSKGQKTIAIDPTDDNKVYIGSLSNGTTKGGRVYRTTDGGTTWSELFRPFDVSVTGESAEITGSTQTRTGKLNNLNNILIGSVSFLASTGESFTDNGNGTLTSNMGGTGTITYTNTNSTSYGNYSLTFGGSPATTTASYTVSYSPSFVYVTSDGLDVFVGRAPSVGSTTLVRYTIATDTITPITLTGTNATYNIDFDTYIDGSSVENLCVSAGLKIACTADKGSNWTYTAAVSALSTYRINHLASTRVGGTLKFLANRALITNSAVTATHYSTDGGATWGTSTLNKDTTMNPTGVFTTGTPRVFYLAFDPFDSTVVYQTDDWRIRRSDNSGATFNEKVTGAPMQVASDITVAPNGRMFLVSMDTGIQYSDDFGTTWVQGTPSTAKGQGFVTGSVNDYGGHYWRVITLGTQEEWDAGDGVVIVTATMYSTPTVLNFVNYVLKSVDNGVTWTRSNSGLPTVALYGDTVWDRGYMRALAKSADESIIYVGVDGENCQVNTSLPSNCTTNRVDGGLFKSTDQGATWTRVWSTPRKIYNALAVDPTDATGQILMFGTFGYNMYRKTGASTANYVGDTNGPTNFIYDVAYDTEGRPYAVVNNSGPAIYRSVTTPFGDGSGQYGTWQLMKQFGTSGIADGLVVDPQNVNRVFVSVTLGTPAARSIYVTPEANRHDKARWYDITGNFPIVGGCQALTINYFEGDKGYLYCASNGGGVWKLAMDDSPATFPNRKVIGSKSLDGSEVE